MLVFNINLRPLILALALLSRYPLPASVWRNEFSLQDHQQSTLYYPLVGLSIALPLVIFAHYLPHHFSLFFSATILALTWIGVTGALHLDGFIDCTDAYFAAHKGRADALRVMKEPRVGAMAVVCTVAFLLLKLACIYELLQHSASPALFLFVCVFARALALVYIQTTHYISVTGIASQLDNSKYRVQTGVILALLFLLAMLSFSFLWAASSFLVLGIALLLWRRYWLKTLGGYSGDCVGALIEIAELVVMLNSLIVLTHL